MCMYAYDHIVTEIYLPVDELRRRGHLDKFAEFMSEVVAKRDQNSKVTGYTIKIKSIKYRDMEEKKKKRV